MERIGAWPEIVELDTGSKHSLEFELFVDGDRAGRIQAHRTRHGGRVLYTVDNVFVYPHQRRRGYATLLYEAAAAEACRRRATLASTNRLVKAFSNQFWSKQAALGRAELLHGDVYALRRELCPVPLLANPERQSMNTKVEVLHGAIVNDRPNSGWLPRVEVWIDGDYDSSRGSPWAGNGYDEDVAAAIALEMAQDQASRYFGDYDVEVRPARAADHRDPDRRRDRRLVPNQRGAMARATFGREVDDEGGRGAERYRIFHDKEPRRVVEISRRHPFPKRVGLAGRALSVSYRTDKWHEDGDDTDYKHVFETAVKVYEPWGAQTWLEPAELPRDYPTEPLALLGQCIGYFLERVDDGEVYEAHLPRQRDTWLLAAPDGRMLFVYDPQEGFRAIMAGGRLTVEEEGIDH